MKDLHLFQVIDGGKCCKKGRAARTQIDGNAYYQPSLNERIEFFELRGQLPPSFRKFIAETMERLLRSN
jgi:hypothetical protein